MPPKISKKNETKKKAASLDDKTFGLKNKKGAKQQQFIDRVTKQVGSGGKSYAQEMEKKKSEDKKKAKLAEIAEMELLFGKNYKKAEDKKKVDPKAKSAKADIFAVAEPVVEDNSNWTEEELRAAIEKKHGAGNKKLQTTTDKVCNSFLSAVEDFKYGWFWECPKGAKCMYRHALPEGYVLKRDLKKLKEEGKDNKISLEDLIEKERAALGVGTKITLESFTIWKKKKTDAKAKAAMKEEKKKKGKAKAANFTGLTGRELFSFNADMGGDDDEAEDIIREKEEEPEDQKAVDVDLNYKKTDKAWENHLAGVVISTDMGERFAHLNPNRTPDTPAGDAPAAATAEAPKSETKEKTAKKDDAVVPVVAAAPAEENLQVDEDLFGGEDFDDIDEQLGDLALEEAGMA